MAERTLIAVYMLTNQPMGTLYVGVTNNLFRRMEEHRAGVFPGFTKTYGLKRLIWYEPHELITSAIQREKTLKHYVRDWKTNLIERENPHWDDLYPALLANGQ